MGSPDTLDTRDSPLLRFPANPPLFQENAKWPITSEQTQRQEYAARR